MALSYRAEENNRKKAELIKFTFIGVNRHGLSRLPIWESFLLSNLQ